MKTFFDLTSAEYLRRNSTILFETKNWQILENHFLIQNGEKHRIVLPKENISNFTELSDEAQ